VHPIRRFFNNEFIKFIITGAINTLFGYVVYIVAYWICNDKTVALALDYILSIVFNFKSYSMLVFKSRNNWKIIRFIVAYAITFALNYLSLLFFCDLLKLNAYIGQIIALCYVPVILYFLLKYYVFTKEKKGHKR
jgi:putative flippase GtrA